MNWLFTTLIVLIIIAAILLILVVLLQNGKGGGLASNFVAGNQTFGVRETTNILEKFSWGLVAFILAASIATAFIGGTGKHINVVDDVIENAESQQAPEFPSAPIATENPATEPTE